MALCSQTGQMLCMCVYVQVSPNNTKSFNTSLQNYILKSVKESGNTRVDLSFKPEITDVLATLYTAQTYCYQYSLSFWSPPTSEGISGFSAA